MQPIIEQKKEEILQQVLEFASIYGWDNNALLNSLNQMGVEEAYLYLYFPGGIDDIITYNQELLNQELNNYFTELAGKSTTQKVKYLVQKRIEIAGNKQLILATIKYLLKPQNAGLMLKISWEIVNNIWYLAGDSATDFNYYSKRALLLGVFKRIIWKYCKDDTPDNIKTWESLDKSLNNIVTFGKKLNNIKNINNNISKLSKRIPIVRMFADKIDKFLNIKNI